MRGHMAATPCPSCLRCLGDLIQAYADENVRWQLVHNVHYAAPCGYNVRSQQVNHLVWTRRMRLATLTFAHVHAAGSRCFLPRRCVYVNTR